MSGWFWDDRGFVPGISPGLSLGQTRCNSGTNPGFLLILHSGSLGQTRGRRAAQKVYVKKVYVPFLLAMIKEVRVFKVPVDR